MPEVTVPFRPAIVSLANPEVKLSCKLSIANVRVGDWYNDDRLIQPSDRVKFGVNGHTHFFEVSNVTSSDLGVYTYRAGNVAVSAVIQGYSSSSS